MDQIERKNEDTVRFWLSDEVMDYIDVMLVPGRGTLPAYLDICGGESIGTIIQPVSGNRIFARNSKPPTLAHGRKLRAVE